MIISVSYWGSSTASLLPNIRWQQVFALTGLLVAMLYLASPSDADSRRKHHKPNIVVILADDLGFGDIGVYGATRIKTPNIDELAANGMRFAEAYASANVCSPSRAGLLTGRYAIRSGLAWKVVTAKSTNGLPDSEETIAELVQRADYRTMLIGKWHLGNQPQHFPLRHGFEQFYGVLHSNDMPDFVLYNNKSEIEKPVIQSTLTKRYTEKAIDFISANAEAPFLLFMSHTFPHIPLFASEDFHGKSDAGLYGDTVEELDWSVGQIVDALDSSGLLENTFIVFTSDNGPFFEGSTAGLRGGKGNSWEGGYRVPFVASWPAAIHSGQVTDSVVSNLDLLPTIAKIVNLKPAAKTLDGASLLPVFQNTSAAVHEYIYYFNNENIVGVRSPDWKLVTHAYYTGSLGAFEKFDQLPGFDTDYPLLFDANGIDGEAYSYADRHPIIVKELQDALENARNTFYPLRKRPSETTYPE